MAGKGCCLICLLAASTLVGVRLGGCAHPDAEEYTVKAAYIRQISKYVTWPDTFTPGGPDEFVIGVLGTDPFGMKTLAWLAQWTVNKKVIVVRRFETLADCTPCHVLFLAPEGAGKEANLNPVQRLAELRKQLNGGPTLLVADQENLGRKGAMINFVRGACRVRFEINPTAAKRAGLIISSNLLKLGIIVTPEDE